VVDVWHAFFVARAKYAAYTDGKSREIVDEIKHDIRKDKDWERLLESPC